jgi:F-type H+-transporting ATPase subunit b
MIDINISVIYQMINFLALMVLLNFVLYRPIRGILQKRSEKMAQLGSDITSSEETVKSRTEQLELQRSEARKEGAGVREELKSEGHEEEKALITAATQEMEEAVAKVRAEIQSEIGQARDELKGQVQSFGQGLAEKILGRTIQ